MDDYSYKKGDETMSDITRKFDAPEKKGKFHKIAPNSKRTDTDDDNDLPVYCICHSSDIDRFMIMCDKCEEWFHGDCIKITEKESKYIKYFYCKTCRIKDPFLKIKYRKNKKKEREVLEKKHDKMKKIKMKRKKSDSSEFHKSASAPLLTAELPKKIGKYEKDQSWKPEKKHFSNEKKNTMNIYSSDSDNEVTKIKSSKEAVSVPKSDSVGDIIKEEIKKIENNVKVENMVESKEIFSKALSKKEKKESKRCGKCDNCLRKENCGRCDTCYDRERFGAENKLSKCRLRRCLNKKSNKKSKYKEKSLQRKSSPVLNMREEKEPVKSYQQQLFNSQPPQIFYQNQFDIRVDNSNQCFGPGCSNSALPSSKYCSDLCGRRLARERLYQILPHRIQEWNSTPTIANEQGKVELERIRTRMEQARDELTALEQKYRKLESIISAGKSLQIVERMDAEDDGEAESDQSIYCVVCGHSVSVKSAIKHMDKCYIKIESLMSFGSVYPTRIEGSQRLFCDAFNEQQQTYCKRLQVLCPEHTKEPKITDDDVCGCPLNADIYGRNVPSKPHHFCRSAKRKCNKHFKWETMYRAEVDLQRIRQWLKIDEIFDEERRIKTAMANRAGVVSLLLHQTIVHDSSCTDMRTKPTVSKKPAYRLMI